MITYEINKKFNSEAECEAWEEENFPNRTYKGHNILCVNHESSWGQSGWVKITTVLCF